MPPRYRTADQNWVRERNLSIVLRYIWEAGGPIARARLAEISGLNKSTIGTLLAQLQAWDLYAKSAHRMWAGRPGVLIDINPDAPYRRRGDRRYLSRSLADLRERRAAAHD
jgi:hypothetical protein